MDSRSPSSAELIGQVEDTVAHESLLATAISFEQCLTLNVQIRELEQSIKPLKPISVYSYLWTSHGGSITYESFKLARNMMLDRKITKLKQKVSLLLPPLEEM